MSYCKIVIIYKDHHAAASAYEVDKALDESFRSCSWHIQKYAHSPWEQIIGKPINENATYKRCGPDWNEIITLDEVRSILSERDEITVFLNGIVFQKVANDHPFQANNDYFINVDGKSIWKNGHFLIPINSPSVKLSLIFISEYRLQQKRIKIQDYGMIAETEAKKEESAKKVNACPPDDQTPTEKMFEKTETNIDHFFKNFEKTNTTQVLEHFYASVLHLKIAYYLERKEYNKALDLITRKKLHLIKT